MTKTTQAENKETAPTQTTTSTKPYFDGFIDILDPNIDGTYSTRREKFYLSDKEVEEFMGEHDPFKYWRHGRIPVMYMKEFGKMLKEDDEEVTVANKVFAKFPGILVFKHKHQALYTLLVPKEYSDLEKDASGELANRLTFCDTRTIVFGPQEGGMYTEKNFINKSRKILEHIAKTNSDSYFSTN